MGEKIIVYTDETRVGNEKRETKKSPVDTGVTYSNSRLWDIYIIAIALYGGDVEAMKNPTDKEIVLLGAIFIAFIALLLYFYLFLGWRP